MQWKKRKSQGINGFTVYMSKVSKLIWMYRDRSLKWHRFWSKTMLFTIPGDNTNNAQLFLWKIRRYCFVCFVFPHWNSVPVFSVPKTTQLQELEVKTLSASHLVVSDSATILHAKIQEWVVIPFSKGIFSEIELGTPALQADSLTRLCHQGRPEELKGSLFW